MNILACHFDLLLKKLKKNETKHKKKILRHGILFCVLVASKNDNLGIPQTFRRIPPHKGLSSINIYRFQAKRARYDHSHGMVCDTVPIFGTKVYLSMGDNVTEESFLKIFS